MRWFRLSVVVAVAALIAGCGDRHLVLNVDVLSYLDPAYTRVAFGPVPAVPGGIVTGEQVVVRDVNINLVDGTNSVAEVQNVAIAMSVIATDSTGSGLDTLRLYISDVDVDPLTTPPAVTLAATLTPGSVDTVDVDFGTDSRVADLFTKKHMRMTLTTSLRGPDSGDDLNGRVDIRSLTATLVAGRKGSL